MGRLLGEQLKTTYSSRPHTSNPCEQCKCPYEGTYKGGRLVAERTWNRAPSWLSLSRGLVLRDVTSGTLPAPVAVSWTEVLGLE